MTLDGRKAKAMELHGKGYNCAQSVLLVFDDYTNIDADIAARIAMGLGGGMGGQGEVCGAVLGMALVAGLCGDADPKCKPGAYAAVRELTRRFRERNSGCHLCRDLKGKCRIPCDDLIVGAVEILHNYLEEK